MSQEVNYTKLSSTLRYVGLNLNPAVLELIITLNTELSKGDVSLETIDAIVAKIDKKNQPVEKSAKLEVVK